MSLKERLVGIVTRWYLARAQRKGFDLSKVALLPDAALLPLKRAGLDPVPELGEIRAREPVSKINIPFGVNVWLVTGYEEAKTVLGNAKGYSNDFANLVGQHGASESHSPGGLGFADPPEHTRLRKLLTPEFTMRRLSRLTPGIKAIVDQRLDAMAAVDGPVDLVEEFALPIPSLVICELLGVPYEDRGEFQRYSMATVRPVRRGDGVAGRDLRVAAVPAGRGEEAARPAGRRPPGHDHQGTRRRGRRPRAGRPGGRRADRRLRDDGEHAGAGRAGAAAATPTRSSESTTTTERCTTSSRRCCGT